jgi:hypothetical protein
MKKFIVLFLPLVIFTIILSVVHVIVSNMLSTAGVDLDKLQTDLTKYQKENTILREHVLTDTSLNFIASSAAKMGFVNAKTNIYIQAPLPLAKR